MEVDAHERQLEDMLAAGIQAGVEPLRIPTEQSGLARVGIVNRSEP